MKTILITQWYEPKNVARRKELEFTLDQNISHQDIDRIILLTNQDVSYEPANNAKVTIVRMVPKPIVPQKHKVIILNPKPNVLPDGNRPKYSDLFDTINKYKKEHFRRVDCLLITANSDIYFHEDAIDQMKGEVTDKNALVLSRWDHTENGLVHFNRLDSQDVWAVKNQFIEGDYNIVQGISGCDNRIAAELQRAGYVLSNPSLDIKTIHYHYEQYNTYSQLAAVPGDYFFIHPHNMTRKKKGEKNDKVVKKRRHSH